MNMIHTAPVSTLFKCIDFHSYERVFSPLPEKNFFLTEKKIGPLLLKKQKSVQFYSESLCQLEGFAYICQLIARIVSRRHVHGGSTEIEYKQTLILKLISKMSLKIVVLAKQVPDTRNVGKDAMTAEGTVNRAALPAIFNPEDLNALEQALRLKDAHPGSTVTILTMGPGRAAEVIREGLFRGADTGYLLTDRAFAGADTLATSYALATAIKKIGEYDIIIGGRQAIDGDTAQVGPQVAEKLGLTQITYAEEILDVNLADKRITVKRHIDGGVETVEGPLPIVITVNGSAAPCRPRNAKLVMKYKRALGAQEKAAITKEGAALPYAELYDKLLYLNITEWSVADVDGDLKQCGLSGSPTKVKAIQNISFQAKESKTLTGSDADIEGLIVELLENHTIG